MHPAEEISEQVISRVDWAEIERRNRATEEGARLSEICKRIKLLEAEIERRKATGGKPFTQDESMDYYRSLARESTVKGNEPDQAQSP
jgi:hypothetical protein